jgi:hypothetical protein
LGRWLSRDPIEEKGGSLTFGQRLARLGLPYGCVFLTEGFGSAKFFTLQNLTITPRKTSRKRRAEKTTNREILCKLV